MAVILIMNVANALVQGLVPDALRGRVMSVYSMTFFGSMPLGALWIGAAAEYASAPVAMIIGALASLLCAGLLGLTPIELRDEDRPLYHAAATIAASFLVTLHRAAAELMDVAGAPPAALTPLMRRTIDNGFAPTGPIVRGDWETVELHREAIRARRPQLEALYNALADASEELAVR